MHPLEEERSFSSVIIDAIRTKNLNLEKLSQLTGISERFLQTLLEEKFDKLPAVPYTHGYLLKIADVLNLDGERLWQDYLRDNEAVRRSGEKDLLPPNRFAIRRWRSKKLIFALIIAVILLFVAVRIPGMFGKPYLSITYPPDNAVLTESTFKATGKISPSDKLTINNETVYSDENGNFEKDVNLQAGTNTLVFKAAKFGGKENVQTRQVFYQPKENQNGANQKPGP